jgi:hypothetical protein
MATRVADMLTTPKGVVVFLRHLVPDIPADHERDAAAKRQHRHHSEGEQTYATHFVLHLQAGDFPRPPGRGGFGP